MTALPEVYDALVVVCRLVVPTVGLTADYVLDGPAAEYAGTEGIAVGATLTDTTGQVTYTTTDLRMDQGETTLAPLLFWSGTGETGFKARRDRVAVIYRAFLAELARDLTLGGVVATSRVVNCAFDQQQTGAGALVLCEARLQYRRV